MTGRIRNLHTQVSSPLQQPKGIPTIGAPLLSVLHFPLKRHFREVLLCLNGPTHPQHLLLPRLLPKRISDSTMKICPALCFHLPTKARLHSLCYSWFFAPASWCSQLKMLSPFSKRQRVTESLKAFLSPVIPGSALKVWLHLIPAPRTPPGSDFLWFLQHWCISDPPAGLS